MKAERPGVAAGFEDPETRVLKTYFAGREVFSTPL